MPIQFSCPHCARAYSIADQYAGKKFACKQCGKPVDVPTESLPAAATSKRAAPAPSPSTRTAPAPTASTRTAPAASPSTRAEPAPSPAAPAQPARKPTAPVVKSGGTRPILPGKLKPKTEVKLPGKSRPPAAT